MIICIYCWAMLFFVYFYASNGNLPIKHRKSDLDKNYDVIDEISDFQRTFFLVPGISAISISVYSVCLCMYNYYVHVHTHKIDSTSPVNQKLGTLFFFYCLKHFIHVYLPQKMNSLYIFF